MVELIRELLLIVDENILCIIEILKVIENMLRISEEAKNKMLELEINKKVEALETKYKPSMTKELKNHIEIVLDLLKITQQTKEGENSTFDFMEELEKRKGFTPQLKNYLTKGKLVTLYHSSSKTSIMHIFLSKNLDYVYFKNQL